MMQSSVLILVALIATVQSLSIDVSQQSKILAAFVECIQSSQVDKELIAKARQGNFADDPKLKDFFGCMFLKARFIDNGNEVQGDVIKSKIPRDVNAEDVEKVTAACKNVKGRDVGETSFLLYKCYRENSPQKISLIGN